jgi:hypothetical protein
MAGIRAMLTGDLQDTSLWTLASGASISGSQKRTGNYSFELGSACTAMKTIPNASAYYAKVGFYSACAGSGHYFAFREGDTEHVTFFLDLASGSIRAKMGSASLANGGTITANTWHCIEAFASISSASGVVTVKVDGTQVLTAASLDTQNGLSGSIDNFYFYSMGASTYLDDIVLRDDTWPGTGGIYVHTASATGNDTAWTPSAGSGFECVDDTPPSFVDYIYSSASAGAKSTFEMSDLSFTAASVKGVGVLVKGQLAAAGVGPIRAILKSDAAYGSGPTVGLSVTPTWVSYYTATDPSTGSTLTQAMVNAFQAGVESMAGD